MIRMDVVSTVEEAGYDVLEATGADAAVAILETRIDVSIVFTDIEMPGSMNGLELAFTISDRWPAISIIIASGRIRPEPDEIPSEAQFLRKPYSEAAVLGALGQAA